MLAKTGLLIVSNPKQIGQILAAVQKQVKNTLYIQLLSLGEPFGSVHPKIVNTWPKFSKTIYSIYSQAALYCYNLDVRVLLSGIKYNIPKIQTQQPIDLVIFDKTHNKSEIDNFINTRIQNITKEYNILTLDSGDVETSKESETVHYATVCKHTVLGGTFDRLHLAHKLLLSEAVLRATEKVTIGITEENMLHSKLLWELIEDVDVRVENITNFLKDICSELIYNVTKISDPFGPAIVDPTMDLIVVSKETIKGGEKINEIRHEKKLKPLEIIPVDLLDEPHPSPIEEPKISSSTTRIRLLGTVLRPVVPNISIPKSPYIIGLTGGIASGKSGVAGWLSELGAHIINCDIIGHNMYKAGKPCHKLLVDHFGNAILADNGEINRQVLGGIVFKDPEQLKALNSLVWPAMIQEIQEIIKNTDKKVVVVEAAVLLNAGWQKSCHEVWTTLVPRDEAINRLKVRNGLSEEEAKNRLNSQQSNTYYIQHANVVFCPLWDPQYTKEQVVRAWDLLQKRLPL